VKKCYVVVKDNKKLKFSQIFYITVKTFNFKYLISLNLNSADCEQD